MVWPIELAARTDSLKRQSWSRSTHTTPTAAAEERESQQEINTLMSKYSDIKKPNTDQVFLQLMTFQRPTKLNELEIASCRRSFG